MLVSCIVGGCSTSSEHTSKNQTKEMSTSAAETSDQTQQKKSVEMGRYVEKTIALPEFKEKDEIVNLAVNKENQPVLYTFEGKGVTAVKYMLQPDGTWEKSTLDWTKQIKAKKPEAKQILCDGKGTEYLFFTEQKADYQISHLYREEHGVQKEIPMEHWDHFEPGQMPENIDMTGNGTFTAVVDGELCCYDTTTGRLIASQDIGDDYVYGDCGNTIVRTIHVKDSDTTELDCYDDASLDAEPEVFQYPAKEEYISELCRNSKGNYVVLGSQGMLESNPKTHEFDTILPGEKTSLYLPFMYVMDTASTKDDTFYAVCDSMDGKVLLQYQYDPAIPTDAEYHLSIYSLYENPVLKTAIVKFQQVHPEYEFTYDYSLGENDRYEEIDTKDYIRAFNTRLLAGDGPDLIDLSNLSAKDFVEKGALLDITDVVEGYLKEDRLFQNIIEPFAYEGKYYTVPLQFSLACIFGPKDVVDCNQLSELVQFAQEHPDLERPLLGEVNLQAIASGFVSLEAPSWLDKNKQLSENQLKEFVQNIKKIYELSEGHEREDDMEGQTHGNSVFGLGFREYCMVNAIENMNYLRMAVSINQRSDGVFDGFHDSFYPINQFGINKDTKNVEAAKLFYSFLLSDEFMTEVGRSNFPVNKSAFTNVKKITYEYNEENGINVRVSENETKFIPIVELTTEQKDQLEQLCLSVNRICETDETMEKIVFDGIQGYVTGAEDLESAMNQLVSKLKLYFSE